MHMNESHLIAHLSRN